MRALTQTEVSTIAGSGMIDSAICGFIGVLGGGFLGGKLSMVPALVILAKAAEIKHKGMFVPVLMAGGLFSGSILGGAVVGGIIGVKIATFLPE